MLLELVFEYDIFLPRNGFSMLKLFKNPCIPYWKKNIQIAMY